MGTAMEKISIRLPGELALWVREKVGRGEYGSHSEVVRAAMRQLLERDRWLGALDSAIAEGLADAQAERLRRVAAARKHLQRRLGKHRIR